MSTSAGVTVPSQRHVYLTKAQLSSRAKPSDKTKPRKQRKKSASSKSKSEGRGEELHKSWGKSKNYAYVFTGTGEEKPWTKTVNMPNKGPRTHKAKPKPPPPPEEENHHIYKIKEDGKKKVKKGTLVVSDKYFEAVKDERSRLLDLLNSLQKRNDVLERENAELVKGFEGLHRENEKLRKKLDTGGEPVIESYKRVFDDRTHLRQAENSYKSIITRLEDENRTLKRNLERLSDELKAKTQKAEPNKKTDQLEIRGKYNKYYWDSYHLRAENEYLKSTVKSLRQKIDSISKVKQKSPQTAPQLVLARPGKRSPSPSPPPQRPTEEYGRHVKFVTLPEIEKRSRQEKEPGYSV